MRHLKTQNYLSLFLITLFLTLACSDSGTNIEDEVAPDIPNLSMGLPEFGFFKAKVNSELAKVTGDNFDVAATLTASVEAIMTGLSTLPESFTTSAQGVDASFSNGIWTWSYTYGGGGSSVTVQLTAEVKVVQTNWAMYISASSEELSFDNYKFMDGHVKNTSNAGEWNFYSFEEESTTPVMSYSWEIVNETNATFTVTFGDASFSGLTYVKATPDNTITLTDEGSSTTVIYWNSTTSAGYYEISNQGKVCWDENGDNVDCPS